MHYDVFNGDADGIIALLQLRLTTPRESTLITGVKRDIQLVKQVVDAGDVTSATILDISMEKNRTALLQLLEQHVPVVYCDHHRSGDLPDSPYLDATINLDAEICTSLLINQQLNGQHAQWAIAAAFGDNLTNPAQQLANQLELTAEQTQYLQELGTLINYNGYGASPADLHIHPKALFTELLTYRDPFALQTDPQSPYYRLKQGYAADTAHLTTIHPSVENDGCKIFELPNAAWARRISGVFGNQLANQSPHLAHAVLTLNPNQQDFTVSVRAPLNRRTGADDVCTQFATGGGRRAAAGINALPITDKARFIQVLTEYYQQ